MADTALAPRLIPLRRRSTGEEMALDPTLEIGVGGEARVLGIRWAPGLVAKLYHRPTLEHARKLALMMETPPTLPAGASIAWPVDLLTDPGGGRFAGFLMPRAEGPRVFEFYNPVSRRKTAPLFDWARLHRAGANLAAAFDGLHGHGYVIGDVNESNILVSPHDASVVLVDADSFQVRGGTARELYRSKVGKAEFTPPELQGTHFADVDRAQEHDRFGLAVLLFLLLMEGTHPFACRLADGGEVPAVEDRIRRAMFPYAPRAEECKPPRMAPPFYTLHPPVQALFLRAFVQGQTDPPARPTAAEWRAALATAEAGLATCAVNPRHRYAPHVDFCPWCHRTRVLQGRDPFPATVDLARAHEAPPLRRPIAPPARMPAGPGAPPRAPATWGAPAVAAPPAVMMAPQPPSALSRWASGALLQTRQALPPSLRPALDADALANPIVWMPPAALTCLFGATGGIRVLGMIVFFLALRRMFRLNTIRVRPVTFAWMAALLALWALMSGAMGGPMFNGANVDDGTYITDTVAVATMPAVIGAGPVAVGIGEPSALPGDPALADGILLPRLLNGDDIMAELSLAYRDTQRPLGVSDEVVLWVPVDAAGHVDPARAQVARATDADLGERVRQAAGRMQFDPARAHGIVMDATVQIIITLATRR